MPDGESILEGPIAGLSTSQHALFLRGDGEFGRPFAPTGALLQGPAELPLERFQLIEFTDHLVIDLASRGKF